ncbi:MAG: glycosyltransferase family 2 protein [Lachnospiraceae bacterium]|nr:glycosyltransferase family 2 protein [Lachnospiraceae bacterium]MDE7177733.1 glycosyltransferase family 2 protein [Lachnospiraceae bacterium]
MRERKGGLISVIVPVYGAEDYIAKTIAMVEAQTFENWELLLIEDASPDESAQVVRRALAGCRQQDVSADLSTQLSNVRTAEVYTDEQGRRILFLCKEKNEGAAAARNTGLKLAQGRYIAFLDADDVWFPDKLAREFAFLQEKQAGFVFSAYEFGDQDAAPTGKVVHVPPVLTYREALSRTVIFTTTVLLDREKVADKLIEMPLVESEDTATWWQILRAGHKAYGLDETLAIYRRPPKSLSSNKIKALQRIWNLYRRQEGLSVIKSFSYFIPWAFRALARRL